MTWEEIIGCNYSSGPGVFDSLGKYSVYQTNEVRRKGLYVLSVKEKKTRAPQKLFGGKPFIIHLNVPADLPTVHYRRIHSFFLSLCISYLYLNAMFDITGHIGHRFKGGILQLAACTQASAEQTAILLVNQANQFG